MVPCILFEDEHLLVVNKPAGLNTHSPSPYAGEGIYDWLRHREPRWSSLAIMHRLDKETSGVLVFSLSPEANRSLNEQFTKHRVAKTYLLLTANIDAPVPRRCKSTIVKVGDQFINRPFRAGSDLAETEFQELSAAEAQKLFATTPQRLRIILAKPLTGRTHQIRLHAAASGFPVLGDELYGGAPAPRLFLHAWKIVFRHPVTGKEMRFAAPPPFLGLRSSRCEGISPESNYRSSRRDEAQIEPFSSNLSPGIQRNTEPSHIGCHRKYAHLRWLLEGGAWVKASESRDAIIDPGETNAFRAMHGAADGLPGCFVDVVGDYLLVETVPPAAVPEREILDSLSVKWNCSAVYHKTLIRQTRGKGAEASPSLLSGKESAGSFAVRENGLSYELSFREGYSIGLFFDQRDNRRRLLTGHVAVGLPLYASGPAGAPSEVLNTFAYTCGFSVAAAKHGARVTSLDLSRKYLDWGRRNFTLNGIDPAKHDFIYGDVFDWIKRLARKGRGFDVILLDPPTFSQSKASGVFRAKQDYGRLVLAASPLLRKGGVLFASTNAADWSPPDFLQAIENAIKQSGRKIAGRHYVPQPLDFPVTREEPAYLKTVWMRIV